MSLLVTSRMNQGFRADLGGFPGDAPDVLPYPGPDPSPDPEPTPVPDPDPGLPTDPMPTPEPVFRLLLTLTY
ncbi:MAG TPA: hypothetical protein VGM27_01115 [Acidobacteriaceae bacterium]|jgi:hypothetical protein